MPAKLNATLAVNSQPSAAGTPNTATFRFDGSVGAFKIDLKGDAGGGPEAFTVANLGKLAAARLSLTGHIDGGDGGAIGGISRPRPADRGR